ncbi:APC family permease [Ramlibacter sp. WS9]|uniref:APC family permease n=1 Tax=Ramlibacter sp. WS9 TaxID=1882741 RepID=UPI001142A4F9|nr:APC family permease [Ramlibacter sp. WS9]ROZ78102.1 APC family permease [Ramlibacter sp. WS9]HSV36690.1 APC family permease [Ramlibacter sp.]
MTPAERTHAHLVRGVVGFPTALATSVGVVMASPAILTATTGFSIGGWAFVAAMLIAFVLMLAQASTFAEAATMLPTAGSVYDYIACGCGRFFAITGTISAYMLVHVFAGTAETILSGVMATVNFPGLHGVLVAHDATWTVGVGMVVLFAGLNYFGIAAFGRVEVVLTFCMWVTLMVFGVLGLSMAAQVNLEGWFGASAVGTDLFAVLSLVGLAMFMFLGVEFVTPLAPDLRNAQRSIPRSMFMGLCLVSLCMLMWGAAMQRQVPNTPVDPKGLVHLLETPEAIPAFAEQVLGPFGRIWLGIAFLLAGAATINTLMAALPRILYGMAVDGALPKAFAYLHPKYRSPVVGIVVSAIIPIAHVIWINGNLDRILPLVLAAVCAWGTAYLMVNVSVVLLRIRRPELPRAYRSPFFPLPQIVSSIGILIAIWYITPPNMNPRDIYVPFGVMLGLTALYALLWTAFVQRRPLFTPAEVEQVLEAEFRRIEPQASKPTERAGQWQH